MSRTPGVDWNIDERVDTLTLRDIKVSGHCKALGVVLGVEEVAGLVSGGGNSLVMRVDFKVLTLVGECGVAVSDSPSGVPVDGESFALGTVEDLVRVGQDIIRYSVGGKTRVEVGSDSVSLSSVGSLVLEVFSVGTSVYVESVTVVGSNQNQGVFELANLLEVLDGSSDGVVEFQQISESSVNVLDVHLFVDELTVSSTLRSIRRDLQQPRT